MKTSNTGIFTIFSILSTKSSAVVFDTALYNPKLTSQNEHCFHNTRENLFHLIGPHTMHSYNIQE
jgi:hypothetical protein